jgi:hypothetical protein
MSMKNRKDTFGNRNRDLPACSAVPQPTAPPRDPIYGKVRKLKKRTLSEVTCFVYVCHILSLYHIFYLCPVEFSYILLASDIENILLSFPLSKHKLGFAVLLVNHN